MITESKVTEIFCIADDFCKEFEVEMAKNALPASPDAPKRRRKRMMSDAEVITILICFHFNSYRNLKHYYLGCVCIHWIRLYCRLKEGYKNLCPDCEKLAEYAENRLRHCPFGDEKGSCRNCKIHCYRPDMKEKIKEVMRFSGPRMLFYHPVMAIRHLAGK